jgi:hypothetical protein
MTQSADRQMAGRLAGRPADQPTVSRSGQLLHAHQCAFLSWLPMAAHTHVWSVNGRQSTDRVIDS